MIKKQFYETPESYPVACEEAALICTSFNNTSSPEDLTEGGDYSSLF